MAQHDYVLANSSGSAFRADLNNALSATVTGNSGTSAPSTTYAYMIWNDTTNNQRKIRNSANNAWIVLSTLSGGNVFDDDVTFNGASSKNAVWDKSDGALEFADDAKATFGNSADFSVYHNGTNSFLVNNTGYLDFQLTDGLTIEHTGGENWIKCVNDNRVELYFDAVLKMQTNSTGIEVTDRVGIGLSSPTCALEINSADNKLAVFESTDRYATLYIVDSIGSTFIQNDSGALRFGVGGGAGSAGGETEYFRVASSGNVHYGDVLFTGDDYDVRWDKSENSFEFLDNAVLTFGNADDIAIWHDGSSYIKNNNGYLNLQSADGITIEHTGGENWIKAVNNDRVELYFDNVKKLNTWVDGVAFWGQLKGDDNNKLVLGSGSDLQLYHDGSDSFIECPSSGTGHLIVKADDFYVKGSNDEFMIKAIENGACEFFHNNNVKCATTSSGITVTGTVNETSDMTLKNNINTIQNPLDLIEQIRGINFTWKTNGIKSMGVLAQDVEKVFPELVHGNEGSKTLQYSGLIGALIESVKELSAKIATLEAK